MPQRPDPQMGQTEAGREPFPSETVKLTAAIVSVSVWTPATEVDMSLDVKGQKSIRSATRGARYRT